MPTLKKGESEEDFVSRCIPFVLNEGNAEDEKQAAAICHSMYKEHMKKTKSTYSEYISNGYQLVSGNIELTNTDLGNSVIINKEEYVEVELIACKGDFFLQNDFVPSDVLKASAEKWSGTIHDISHMATNYPNGLAGEEENIEYEVGFNKFESYDENTKELKVKSYIRKDSPKFNAWKNHVAICKASGKTPNVSISALAKKKLINASEIPSGTKIPVRYKNSSKVIAIADFLPLGITTCMLGKCNDADGCGIILKGNDTCLDGSCGFDNATKENEREIKRKEYLKKRIEEMEKI